MMHGKRAVMLLVAGLAILSGPAMAASAPQSGFDVDQATRLWLDTLQGPARARSDAYFEGGYWLPLWGTLIAVLIDWALLHLRLSARFRDWGSRISQRPSAIAAVTVLLYLLAGSVLTLPWTIYSQFIRERSYGLMNLSFGGWLGEQAISLAFSLVVGTAVLAALYAAIRRFPRRWWVLGTGIVAVFAFVALLLAPIYLSPLFNTYREMPQGPLRDRIVAMANRFDVQAKHIYVFDASKQSDRISANVSGIGPTIRISLNDNLLNRSTPEEIEAVMGHELGHYVLGHAWRNIAFLVVLAALCLFVVARIAPWLIARYGQSWGVQDLSDPASVPVMMICISILSLLATPLTNSLIRIDESEADAFGLDAAREPDAFAAVAMKLADYRKIEPGPVEEMLFFDHPSGATRVRMAMQWKKDHVPDARMVRPAPLPQHFGEHRK